MRSIANARRKRRHEHATAGTHDTVDRVDKRHEARLRRRVGAGGRLRRRRSGTRRATETGENERVGIAQRVGVERQRVARERGRAGVGDVDDLLAQRAASENPIGSTERVTRSDRHSNDVGSNGDPTGETRRAQ
jgi:hypothetical protein